MVLFTKLDGFIPRGKILMSKIVSRPFLVRLNDGMGHSIKNIKTSFWYFYQDEQNRLKSGEDVGQELVYPTGTLRCIKEKMYLQTSKRVLG
jgi:hypothetical protein